MGTIMAAIPTGRLDFFATFLVERVILWNAVVGRRNLSGVRRGLSEGGSPGGDCRVIRR